MSALTKLPPLERAKLIENNGTQDFQDPQNGASTSDDVNSFPSSDDTQLRDISTLLQDAPVIQQQAASASNGSTNGSAVPAKGSAIATSEDFEQIEEKRPFARKIGPKTIVGAVFALALIIPFSNIFMSGGNRSNSNQIEEVSEVTKAEDGTYISAEEYAALQAELEQRRSQQAFIDQQVDAEAIDAAGRQRQQQELAKAQQAQSSTQSASSTTASTASRPTPTTTRPSAVTVRPAPAPPRAATPSRPAPVTIASRGPAPAAQRSSPQAAVRASEPVDPFERRAQLQALGSYGAPPPRASTVAAQPASYSQSNPFDSQYIQAISVEPQVQPAILQETEQVEPLTEVERRYEADAAAVLFPSEGEDSDAAVQEPDADEADVIEPAPPVATPLAILPGTSAEAELSHRLSWQEGGALPEVVLSTTEDIMAGDQAVIPAGTEFLGQARVDPRSGAVTIQIVGMFGASSIPIPRASVIVQAEDGGVLTASASGGASRSSGSNMGSFLMRSLSNGLGNVIDGDDNLALDIAGGVAETVIDNQVERSEANARAHASRTASRPVIWTLDTDTVRLVFNNYIPLHSAQR